MLDAGAGAPVAHEESSLVARAAAGDRAAFTSLVADHHADMLRLAGIIAGDGELAQDAVQLAWQRAWLGLRRLRDHDRIRPWLLSIAANETRQILRRRRSTESVPDYLFDALADPASRVDYLDLDMALDRMHPTDRELLGLRYVLGFTSVELAAYLHTTPEGVRGRLKRLVDRLRKELADG
jgi:RNA polymerase sigma-70 factor, ECF subfamily